MKVIIFAGGMGKRLWPISTPESPKQFQKIFNNQTSLEHAYYPLRDEFGVENIFISTTEDFAQKTIEILKDFNPDNLILEPSTRDNGPAVAFAMHKISEKYGNEPIVIRWQNSVITNPEAFINAIRDAEKIINNKQANLVYLGVPSRFPNTSLGHIKIGDKLSDSENTMGLYEFEGFVEKPDLETAQKYHESGNYLWNPGCYITTPNFILESIKVTSPEIFSILDLISKENDSSKIKDLYSQMPKISIDYALWEKLDKTGIVVVKAEYGWYYISTWLDIKNFLLQNNLNTQKGDVKQLNSSNVLAFNYNSKQKLCLVGVHGINVICTENAILVVSDQEVANVKKLVEELDKNN